MVVSACSNHAGLSLGTKRSAIRRLAMELELTATPTSHQARTTRFDIGNFASTQARSARYRVQMTGGLDEWFADR